MLESQREAEAKTQALIAYILMAIGLFTGLFWLIGAIWAMVKKSSAEGTLYYHHFTNMITTFWVSLLLSILGSVTAFLMIGYVILIFDLHLVNLSNSKRARYCSFWTCLFISSPANKASLHS